jgi:hypothetical protein
MDILPASLLPVIFLPIEFSHTRSLRLKPQPQTCCPGNNCFRARPFAEQSCLGCQPVTRLEAKSCSDPAGSCLLPTYSSISCIIPETGQPYLCLEVNYTPCGGPVPTPTPFPTPEPEPTATPKPTPCPLVCSESYPSIPADPCTIRSLGEPACPPGYERAGNCFDYPLA